MTDNVPQVGSLTNMASNSPQTASERETLFATSSRAPQRPTSSRPATGAGRAIEIQPIETRYAGYRFRSRTEAKWAVAFDKLGIEWVYEPETYQLGPLGNRRWYLPDFYLPRQSVWVEVKGHAAAVDGDLMLAAADPVFGLPLSLGGPVASYGLLKIRLLILGPVPAVPTPHDALVVLGGEALARSMVVAGPAAGGAVFTPIGFPVPARADSLAGFVDSARPLPAFTPGETIKGAYRAARMARFEHGESGAPKRAEPVPGRSPNPTSPRVSAKDGLTRFVDSRCLRGRGHEVRPADLRAAYSAWCATELVTAVTSKEMTLELRRLGVELSRGRRPRVYLGLSLFDPDDKPARCSRCAAGELHYLEPGCDRPGREPLDGMNPARIE